MKRSFISCCITIALIAFVSCSGGAGEKVSDDASGQEVIEPGDAKTEVLEVVRGWYDAINARDYAAMERLLGPHVKFYTQVYTPAQCVDDERKALKKYPDFKVYIASGIDVLKTGENAVKASYTIHTSRGGKSKTHNAYLRLNRIDDRWYITAVSDETTDLNVARRSANIPSNALAGDFNGDGNTEYLWTDAQYDDEGYALTSPRLVSDAGFIPPLEWNEGLMGVLLVNLGPLDGSGRDFLGAIPYGLSSWCTHEAYYLKDGRWQTAVEPFTVFLGDDDDTKRINRVKGKPGYVSVIYNKMDGEDFDNHIMTVKLK